MRIGLVLLAAMALTACGNSGGDAVAVCHNAIENQLRSPSSADFDTRTIDERDDGGYEISGTVDAENGFGASLRSDFSCTIGSSGRVISTDLG